MCRSGEVWSETAIGVKLAQFDHGIERCAFERCGTDQILADPVAASSTPKLEPASLAVDHPDLPNARQCLVVDELSPEVLDARAGRQNLDNQDRPVDLAAWDNRR